MLPLLQLDYVVPVDAKNAVDRARTHKVGFNARMQDGMPAPRGVNRKVEASYEDGKNWTTAHAARRGSDGQFIAKLLRPSYIHGDAYVTLRVTATDAVSSSIQQTVVRAFLQRGPNESPANRR